MKQILFYATGTDLLPVVSAVEADTELQYFLIGNFDKKLIERHSSGMKIPGLGVVDVNYPAGGKSYLVMATGQQLEVRVLKNSSTGKQRFLIDQLENDKSITFDPGGRWDDATLLHGRVATVWDDAESQALMKRFAKAIRAQFKKVNEFWVGPEAEQLWNAGTRLTLEARASSSVDLKR